MLRTGLFLLALFWQCSCFALVLNNPYPASEDNQPILYASFSERPKTLDPARSYSSNEFLFIAQIYEPPLQYHYLKRPYQLIPLTAADDIKPSYLDKDGRATSDANKIAYSVYDITIKPGIYYQPHPALARKKDDSYYYHHLNKDWLAKHDIYRLADFEHQGSRECVARDYVYQIKRLASPEIQSPIFGLMSEYIVGLKQLAKQLATAKPNANGYLDLREFSLTGVEVLSKYRYRITIKGQYPQFRYWLAMPFFSPMPWEADLFDSQPGMQDRNLTLDWYPIGTGPYQLVENDPNRQMVLIKNPNFHGEAYPTTGEAEDKTKGLLADAGKPLPFIEKVVFKLEKESIPRWNKFLQGYYDSSGVSSDSFDQAIYIGTDGDAQLTKALQEKSIRLQTTVSPSIFYLGFNMLDPVVGGYSERARKLRQAISIAIDQPEYIEIFLNGRGIAAQGPIPPGIFGYRGDVNELIYQWLDGKLQPKPIEQAKQLLKQAGYANGRDNKTGKPLVLNYDVPASSGPDDKARFDWYRKQFAKLGIQLHIRATQYNRFQQKMRQGNSQIFSWGWHADYPDPENFLFLLYGPNGKVKHGGENATNYADEQFDKLFEQMKAMPNTPKRQKIIDEMTTILRHDAPMVFGVHPKDFILTHDWKRIDKPNPIASNTLKYSRIDPLQRKKKRTSWNHAIVWPFALLLFVLLLTIIPVVVQFYRREHRALQKK